jgi:endo-1,4-beta-xylanase
VIRKRSALFGLIALTLLLPSVPVSAKDDGSKPLRLHAVDQGVYLGTMIASIGNRYRAEEANDKQFLRQACVEFNMLTPGNALKFGVLQPGRGHFKWMPAEDLMNTALKCGMRVVGNALVWHEQLPSWLYQYDGQPEQVRQILKSHITQVVRHFAGRIAVWDVVNEAVLPNGSLRNTFWLRNLGPGYVADAFRWARQADPAAKLYYNDYGNEAFNNKSNSVYKWVKAWLAQGAPIDGVGMQIHSSIYGAHWKPIARNMRRYAALKLATRVSEMDLALRAPVGPGQLAAQAWVYYNTAKACFSPGTGCKMFTVWGFTDRYWDDPLGRGRCCGLLFDGDYQRKLAYYAVAAAIDQAS